MSPTFAAILFFAICTAHSDELCEEGQAWARSCAVAEQHLRAGLREGQTLHVWACEVRP